MTRFNLSEWGLNHRSFVLFLMLASVIAGVLSYRKLGREEDPSFAVKTMVVVAVWPGATIGDTLDQVTDRIEKEIQQIDSLDYTRSYTVPGRATVFVEFKDTTDPKRLPDLFYQVRKHINDIRSTFPETLQAISFNDEFGDVFGNIYAFTADGLSMRQLRDYVEGVRNAVLHVNDIGKTELIGTQDEAIYLDISARKLAGLKIDIVSLIKTLQAQNAVAPSGIIQAGAEQVSVRVGGHFVSEESLRAINLRVNDQFFRLSDVADIRRGYVDPPQPMFRFNGQPAIGLAIAMRKGGNLLNFGEELKTKMRKVEATLPIGVGVHLVSDQPRVVEKAVGGFTEALVEAIAIVLLVSFLSLGVRAGLVVSVSIPLVLAVTFIVLDIWGISLQRISLGALIIALGLLVDDAMITVEMMVARLEAGDTKTRAATFAYTSTAFPMLTGTLVTVAGFLPIGFNASAAGEYTYSLFVVITVALLISWIVAVLFAPLVGVALLPATMRQHGHRPSRFLKLFRAILLTTLSWRRLTIGMTLAALALSIFGLSYVQQQFFPSSDRPEILIDLTLPQTSSIAETNRQMARFEERLKDDPDIEQWSSYVGQGAIRFYLPLDQQLENAFFGQFVIQAKSLEARNRLIPKLQQFSHEQFVGIDVFIHTLDLGPPVGRPIQYRLSGPDLQSVRERALSLAGVVSTNPHVAPPTFDWNEPGEVLRVEILQDEARALGITSQDIANFLNGVVGGTTITQVRDFDLFGQRRGPGAGHGPLFAGHAANAANRPRQWPHRTFARLRAGQLRHRAADRLAPQPLADNHRARQYSRRHPAGDCRQAVKAVDRRLRQGAPYELCARDRRGGRGKRQVAGAYRGRRAGDAARHGVSADGSAAKFRQACARRQCRAARSYRRRRGAFKLQRAARLCGAARRPCPYRHHHSQFGDLGDADRRIPPRGPGSLGRRR